MRDLEESIRCSAGEGWDSERERFKHIIDDRDNQITQLKIEYDVARSQVKATDHLDPVQYIFARKTKQKHFIEHQLIQYNC
jgi:uncharacterized membrane-anchored protein